MAQFIRNPFDGNFDGVVQVCQISYHGERLIEIWYDIDAGRPIIQDNGIIALGIANEHVVVTWTPDGQPDDQPYAILNSNVSQAPLCQMAIYPNNQPIPQNHNAGPLPMIAREPAAPIDPNAINAVIPDAVDNDDRSTITDYHNEYLSDDDSDNGEDD